MDMMLSKMIQKASSAFLPGETGGMLKEFIDDDRGNDEEPRRLKTKETTCLTESKQMSVYTYKLWRRA